MKHHEPPIPVRSVVCLPRWLMLGGTALSAACIAAGVGMIGYAIGWAEPAARGGLIGGAVGCVIGGAGGLFGTLNDWHRRLPATALWQHLRHDRANALYRRAFWPSLALLAAGLVVGWFWPSRAIWHGVVQTSAILAFVAGTIEAARRHTTRQARAVFALYADGLLAADEAAAIDDARRKDAAFDAAVRAWSALSTELRTREIAASQP